MSLAAWHWLVGVAILLLVVEALVPGFVFAGFAVGALALAVLHLLSDGVSLALDLLVFSLASAAGFFGLRRVFRHEGDSRRDEDDVNRY